MRSAAIAIDCSPDEQKRLMVSAETSTGKSGAKRGDAGDVHSLLGFGHGAAEDDIFDFFGIELGHAVESAFDRDGRQFIGTSGAERALEGASYGSADGGGNDDFTHKSLAILCSSYSMRTVRLQLHFAGA